MTQTKAQLIDGKSAEIEFSGGSAGAPAISFTGDTNTGIYSPGADQLALSTNGTGRLFVDASGEVGIGTASPNYLLHNEGGTIYSNLRADNATSTPLRLSNSSTTGTAVVKLAFSNAATVKASINAAVYGNDYLAFNTGSDTERLRITSTGQLSHIGGGSAVSPAVGFNGSAPSNSLVLDSTGRLGIGTSLPNATLHVVGTGLFRAQLAGSSASLPSESTALSVLDGTNYGSSPSASFTIGANNWDAVNNNTAFQWKITTPSASASAGTRFTLSSRSFDGTSTYTETPRLTILSGGNVGIGTTSPNSLLHVNGEARFGASEQLRLTAASTDAYVDAISSGGNLAFRTNGGAGAVERARIDSSGRLLVGTSSARSVAGVTGGLQLTGTGSSASFNFTRYTNDSVPPLLQFGKSRGATDGSYVIVNNGDQLGSISFSGSDGTDLNTRAAQIECRVDGTPGANDMPGRLVFSTTADGASSPTERMRITQNGSIIFDGTGNTNAVTTGSKLHLNSTAAGLILYAAADGDKPAIFNRNGSDGVLVDMRRANVSVGTISVTTTATAYNTSSDYRLKENVTPVTDGITRLQQLKPSRFNFIADPAKTVDGFLAHEVQTVVPEAITGEKDAVDDEGNPLYQGIDQSKLVPLLTAALQEAVAKIKSLEARLTAAGI